MMPDLERENDRLRRGDLTDAELIHSLKIQRDVAISERDLLYNVMEEIARQRQMIAHRLNELAAQALRDIETSRSMEMGR